MANTVSAVLAASITATEVIDVDLNNTAFSVIDTSTVTQLKHYLSFATTIDASTTTVPSTKAYNASGALTDGAATLDLTALYTYQNQALDLSGLVVQAIMLQNRGSNVMTFDTGDTNGYDIFGAATGSITLPAANGTYYPTVWFFTANGLEDIDATHKTIDIAGTGTDAYKIVLVAG